MALDGVSKIEVLCHAVRRADVLAAVESSGNVQLKDISEVREEKETLFKPAQIETSELAEKIADLEKTISFLEGYITEKKKTNTPVMSEDELLDRAGDDELTAKAAEAWNVAVNTAKREGGRKELEQEKQFLLDWHNLSIPLEEFHRRGKVLLRAGVLERESIQAVHSIEAENELFHIEVIDSGKSSEQVVLAMHCSESEVILKKLSEYGFTGQDFGGRSGTVGELLKEVKEEIDHVQKKEASLKTEAETFAEMIPEFKILLDAAGLLLLRQEAAANSRASRSIFLLEAWIRDRDLDNLKANLESLGEVSVSKIEPEEGEIPPSPLTETPAMDPYALLTDMYGYPTRKELDPTALMAPFYAFFFGICIGDAGYGIALAILAALGSRMTKKKGKNPRLFNLLFQGGIASIIVGVFLGGWFGADYALLPYFLQAPANLLNNLVPGFVPGGGAGQRGFGVSEQFLYLTLAFGFFQLLAGIVINLVKRLKIGEGVIAIVDQTGWLLAMIGLFPWLFNNYLLEGKLYNANGPVGGILLMILGGGALLIFIMGGREAKGLGKLGLGAYAMYGIVNLLGDVLSYSRLFALALSSAIIARVINEIAGQLPAGIPVLGLILAIFLLAGGHLFNLAMACLSGFIHTARLQFVEFFGKFYDGTGKAFKPFRYESKYVQIDRKNSKTKTS